MKIWVILFSLVLVCSLARPVTLAQDVATSEDESQLQGLVYTRVEPQEDEDADQIQGVVYNEQEPKDEDELCGVVYDDKIKICGEEYTDCKTEFTKDKKCKVEEKCKTKQCKPPVCCTVVKTSCGGTSSHQTVSATCFADSKPCAGGEMVKFSGGSTCTGKISFPEPKKICIENNGTKTIKPCSKIESITSPRCWEFTCPISPVATKPQSFICNWGAKTVCDGYTPRCTLGTAQATKQCGVKLCGDGANTLNCPLSICNLGAKPMDVCVTAFTCFKPKSPGHQTMMKCADPTYRIMPGETLERTIDTVCISPKTTKPPPPEDVGYEATALDERDAKALIMIFRSARTLEKQNEFKDLPIPAAVRAQKVAQLAIWKHLGARTGNEADRVSQQSIREEFLCALGDEYKNLTESQNKKVDAFVSAYYSAVEKTLDRVASRISSL